MCALRGRYRARDASCTPPYAPDAPAYSHGPNPDRRPTGHQDAARTGNGFRVRPAHQWFSCTQDRAPASMTVTMAVTPAQIPPVIGAIRRPTPVAALFAKQAAPAATILVRAPGAGSGSGAGACTGAAASGFACIIPRHHHRRSRPAPPPRPQTASVSSLPLPRLPESHSRANASRSATRDGESAPIGNGIGLRTRPRAAAGRIRLGKTGRHRTERVCAASGRRRSARDRADTAPAKPPVRLPTRRTRPAAHRRPGPRTAPHGTPGRRTNRKRAPGSTSLRNLADTGPATNRTPPTGRVCTAGSTAVAPQ